MTTRTLVVGWDSACWEYLDPLMAAGRLPTLRGLIDRGMRGVLASTIPPVTPVAWTSFITGKNPGKHGIFGWQWRRPGTWDFLPFSGSQRVGSPWWKYLNDAGLRVGLVNVPMTYPPEPVDGFCVCDFGAPALSADLTHPQALQGELEREFGWQGGVWPGQCPGPSVAGEQFLAAETAKQRQLVRIALHLGQRYDVDVLAINLQALDHGNHLLRDDALLAEAIEGCDRDLAALVDGFRPDDVMLFSDHGARRVQGAFLIGHWLHDQGYLAWKRREDVPRDHLNWLLSSLFQQHLGWSGRLERWNRRLALEALWRLPGTWSAQFWEVIGRRVPALGAQYHCSSGTDFARSAVHPGDWGVLYMNVAGRDPQGVVPAAGQEELIARLSEQLLSLVDPDTAEPIVSAVYRPRDIYSGPFAGSAPDLILCFWGSRWRLDKGMTENLRPRARYFVPPRHWYGDHVRDGIFCFAGESFAAHDRLQTACIADVPAALLYRYGLPIPEDWDGNLLLDLFDAGLVQAHPPSTQPGDSLEARMAGNDYSAEQTAEVAARLRALGYLD